MATAAASITTSNPTDQCFFPVSLRGYRPSNPSFFLSGNPNLSPGCKVSPLIARRLQVTAISTTGSINEGQNASPSSLVVGGNDLLIVGPGVLGRLVAKRWQEEHPECQIFGETATMNHHDELIKNGINPSLKGTLGDQKFPYVIYCAPPSRTPDYPGDVREATLSWSGEGSFLFTSSSAPYDRSDNGPCNEDSPIVPIGRSPKIDALLKAESVVLESGGCVVRLAGLYKEDRGAHVFWLKKGTVDSSPDHILNLIHYENLTPEKLQPKFSAHSSSPLSIVNYIKKLFYKICFVETSFQEKLLTAIGESDAASLSVAILKKKVRGRIYLGCDNHPLSRQEVMDLINASGRFNKKFDGFTGSSQTSGKKLDNVKTRKEIGWEPKYQSFAEFLGLL